MTILALWTYINASFPKEILQFSCFEPGLHSLIFLYKVHFYILESYHPLFIQNRLQNIILYLHASERLTIISLNVRFVLKNE